MHAYIIKLGMKKISRKTKNIIITSSVCVVALTTGISLGLVFGMEYLGPRVNYGDYNVLSLEDDNAKLYREYQKINDGDYSRFEPYEMANIAIYGYQNSEYHYSYSSGVANASLVKQNIYATSIRNGDEYFTESISSSSLVNVAKRFYQDNSGVTTYTGSVEGKGAKWKEGTKEVSSFEEFENQWGKVPSRSCIYIISSKTVLDSNVEKTEDGYIVDVSLDPVKSVIRYVRQMVSMSDLSREPSFKTVDLRFVLDNQLNLKEMTSHEIYDVYKFGTHTTDSTINEYFFIDDGYKIPDLNTNCDYGGLE